MEVEMEKTFLAMLKGNKDEIYRVAYGYLRNEQDALDAIGEATFKGLKSLKKIKDMRFIKTWFIRILINECIKIIRKRKRLVLNENYFRAGTFQETDRVEVMDLRNSIEELPIKYRTVILLRYINGMQIKEISDVLELNENTVKTRLKRGLGKLKQSMIGGEGNEESRKAIAK